MSSNTASVEEDTSRRTEIATALSLGEDLVAFPTLFQRQVRLTPDRVAAIQSDRKLSYRDLEDLANRYASSLIASGVTAGRHVGLCLDRSPEAIAAMLGVMMIGATFVPLDPEYPIDRLGLMVADAQIEWIIAEPRHREMLEIDLHQRILSDTAKIAWIEPSAVKVTASTDLPHVEIDSSDVAYVMYTSGSTGTPKGVQIDHAALATYCFADIDIYQLVPTDRTLQFSTLNFDIAIEEIFPPLLTGGCVVVRPSARANDRNELSSIVKAYDITAIHLATAYWHQWVDLMVATGERVPESIRLMIVTGEKVSVEHYRRWHTICGHDVLWCNAYGPTEATVSSTVFIPDERFDAPNMPIGKPLKRYEAHILDDSLCEVSIGQTGQLFIGGPALAKGYLNQPELTEKAFVIHPSNPERRLYRTGDLARWLPDGNIDFGGRVDHQIKLGSYRIEPGEIEAALDQHPSVLESLVSYDELEGTKFLMAYVAIGKNSPSPAELANFLRDRLPSFMIPTRYSLMSEFPKTVNGKIDREKLDPYSSVVARSETYVAPRNEMEAKLASLWEQVLNVPEVGIHDDFFLLGGSSLLVTQVVARLTVVLQIELPVRDFFANPTVATAAKHLISLMGNEVSESEDIAERRQRLPHIRADYFTSGRDRLFGVHYQPPARTLNHTVLMCHAYGHEYARSFRNLQQLAVQLCQTGFDVFRFDYASMGNSTGNCEQATFEQFQTDIRAAAVHIKTLTPHAQLSAVGIRLGATALASAQLSELQNMILWDPVIDGAQLLDDLQRFHDNALSGLTRFNQIRTVGPVDQLFGHRMSQPKRLSFAGANLLYTDPKLAKQSLIVSSRGYLAQETGWQKVASRWKSIVTSDEIRWHDPDFTESAFSSPEIYRVIHESLLRSIE